MGQFLSWLHLPLPGRWRLHTVCELNGRRRTTDVLELSPGRDRTAFRLSGVLRSCFAVPDSGMHFPLGAAVGERPLGLDGWMDIYVGTLDHDRCGRSRIRALSAIAAWSFFGQSRRCHGGCAWAPPYMDGSKFARYANSLTRGVRVLSR